MRAQKASVRERCKMAASLFRASLRGWRTGVQPGCGLRWLVRALSLEVGEEGCG